MAATIEAGVIRTIALELLILLRSDARLRELQGINAPRAAYFDRRSITGAGAANTYKINEAQQEIFSSLVITFDQASGAGSYRVDGIDALPLTGVEIPAGGGILTIQGSDNIRGFSMVARAAATLTFARYLYK
jgi:hypothetical protein